MNWLLPSVIFCLCGVMGLFFVYGYLYHIEKANFIKMWSYCWLLYILHYMFSIGMIYSGLQKILLIGDTTTFLLSALFLLNGTYYFIDQNVNKIWLAVICSVLLSNVFFITINFNEWFYRIPTILCISAAFIWTGITIIKSKKINKSSGRMIGSLFMLWGLHELDYPLLVNKPSSLAWGFLFMAFLQFTVSIAVIMMHYQKVKRELMLSQGIYKDGNNKLRTIIENQTDIIYELDNEKTFKFVSSASKNILGLSPEELVGYSFTKFIAFNTETKIKNSKNKNYQFDSIYNCKDGKTKYLNISYNPLYDENSYFIGAYGAIRDVTENKKLSEVISRQEAYFKQLFDNSPDAIAILDENDSIININEGFTRMFQYKAEEIKGCFINEIIVPNNMAKEATNLSILVVTGGVAHKETVRQRKDGTNIDVSIVGFPIKFENHTVGTYALYTDITKRKKAENEIMIQRAYFKQLFDNSPNGIVMLDNERKITMANKGFVELFGYSQKELTGKVIDDLIVLKNDTKEASSLSEQALDGDIVKCEAVRKCKDGKRIPVEILAYPIIIDDKQTGIYATYSNITERKVAEDKLRFLNHHDVLTRLYNRNYFEEIMKCYEGNTGSIGMIMFDVDGLKLINDTMGHDAGDSMLVAAANLLRLEMPEKSILARIGGDEFAAIISFEDKKEIEEICQKVRTKILQYNEAYPGIPLSISAGFSLMENKTLDMKYLFKEADNEMYREKLHRSQSTRSSIVQALMRALEARDYITEGHADRLQNLVEDLAKAADIPSYRFKDLRLFAQFHDIGKVGIPDSILNKPGVLTVEEKMVMQHHSQIGFRIAQASQDLEPIGDWILKHHEWWNGGGYPIGLKEDNIPVECRILAIADAYDAMINDRPYRKALTKEKAIDELQKCSGKQFDPILVKKFVNIVNTL